jgi:hypothetical protein
MEMSDTGNVEKAEEGAKRDPGGAPQLLHLVIGGELEELGSTRFKDLDAVDIIGVYPNYARAYDAWKEVAQKTVDDAHIRYFIVHLHRLLDPEGDNAPRAGEARR